MRKLCTVLLAAMAVAVLGLQGTATAAPAGWPTGCEDAKYDNGWYAACRQANGGRWKASVTCVPLHGGPDVTRDGAWVTSGMSLVFCPPLTVVKTGGVWTRSY